MTPVLGFLLEGITANLRVYEAQGPDSFFIIDGLTQIPNTEKR